MTARTIVRFLVLLLLTFGIWNCGRGFCQEGGANPFISDFPRKGHPTAALFFSSVTCQCILERCQKASAACDSVFENPDSSGESPNFEFVKVDLFEKEYLEKRFEIEEVPTLIIFDSEGIETARLAGIVSVRRIRETLQQLKEE
jgi:hypothetical protein